MIGKTPFLTDHHILFLSGTEFDEVALCIRGDLDDGPWYLAEERNHGTHCFGMICRISQQSYQARREV